MFLSKIYFICFFKFARFKSNIINTSIEIFLLKLIIWSYSLK